MVEPTTAAAPSTADTTWTTAYGKTGLPATVTEPGGVSLSYGYDPLGDITSESGSGASASTAAQSFTYDLDGRIASASAPGGTDSFSYDADSRLKNATGPSGTSGYTYNGDGLIASETSAAGTASYTYDGADRFVDGNRAADQRNAHLGLQQRQQPDVDLLRHRRDRGSDRVARL